MVKNEINSTTKESERAIERETAKSNRFDETRYELFGIFDGIGGLNSV
jgi:hypothetical protein